MDRLYTNSTPDYSSSSGGQRVVPLEDDMTSQYMLSYKERSERLKQLDNEKNNFIDDLIHQLQAAEQELNQVKLGRDRDTRFNREGRLREDAMRDELNSYRSMLGQETYVFVLIDAETSIFLPQLLCKGEAGGIEAANLIKKRIEEHTIQRLPEVGSDLRLHIRLFADLKRVANNLVKAKFIDSSSLFDDFVRAMNGQSSIDFIDSGSQSGFTKTKVIENYINNIRNCHCHQIYLAVTYHQDYECILGDYPDVSVADRVTYIKTLTKSSEKITSKLPSICLDSIFLDKLPDLSSMVPVTKVAVAQGHSRMESGTSVRSVRASSQASMSNTPAPTWASMTAQPFVPSIPISAGTAYPSTSPSPPTGPASMNIPRNKNGQRIDFQDESILYSEIQRIKKLKLCNIFYLQGAKACNGRDCGHSHTFPLSPYEKRILREVARLTPCYHKTDCVDPGCIYGHRCSQNDPSSLTCFYGDKCHFKGWGHGIDLTVVKTTNVKV